MLHFEIHTFINHIWSKEKCYSSWRNLLLYQSTTRV